MSALIDQYIDALLRDPHALPPQEMDAETVTFVRALFATSSKKPDATLRARIWQRALDAAKTSNHAIDQTVFIRPNSNGHHPPVRNNLVAPMPFSNHNSLPVSTHFKGILTLVAAIALVVFGVLLLTRIGGSETNALSPGADQASGSPAPQGSTTPIPSSTPFPTTTPMPSETMPLTPTPIPMFSIAGQVMIEALGYANVRSGPDIEAPLLGQINNGTLYIATGRYFEWIEFQIDQQTQGWVFGELVNVIGDLNTLPDLSGGEVSAPTPDPTIVTMIPGTRLPSNLVAIMYRLQQLPGDPQAGAELYDGLGCSSCHTNGTAGTQTEIVWQQAQNAIMTGSPHFLGYTTEMYIAESILYPAAYIVPGYENLMPDNYDEQLTIEQLADLVAYLRSFALPQSRQITPSVVASTVPTIITAVEPTSLQPTVVFQEAVVEPIALTATSIIQNATETSLPPPTYTPIPYVTVIASDQFSCPEAQHVLEPIAEDQPIAVNIASPASGDVVSGPVQIIGTVTHPQFWIYQLEFSTDPNANTPWYGAAGAGVEPVPNGVLGVWDTSMLLDGVYQLRLSVCLKDNTAITNQVNNIYVLNLPTPVPASEQSANDPLILTATALAEEAEHAEGWQAAANAALTPVPTQIGYYMVQAGDTLVSITLRFDTTLQTLADLNPQLDFSDCDFSRLSGGLNCVVLLQIGETINVPIYDLFSIATPLMATPTPIRQTIPFLVPTVTPP